MQAGLARFHDGRLNIGFYAYLERKAKATA